MSRVKEVGKDMKCFNEERGRLDSQEWIAFWLEDIALSLARIVDALEEEKE